MLDWDRRTRASIIKGLLAIGWATGCGSPHSSGTASDTDPADTDRGTSELTSTSSSQDGLVIEATVTRVVLDIGEDEPIQLLAHDADQQSQPVPEGVVWISSDPTVASVDESGLVKAWGTGDAIVTASVAGQEVEVQVRVRGFTTAPVKLTNTLNVTTEPSVAVVADGHGIAVHTDRDGVHHRVRVHAVDGAMGWQPNAVSMPSTTYSRTQAVPMSGDFLVAIREGNEPTAYFVYQPAGGLVPRPLPADTVFSDLAHAPWTDEAFVFHAEASSGPLHALGVRADDFTDFGSIDAGGFLGAAFDATGRGHVLTWMQGSSDLRVVPYEPGAGFGTPTVIASDDAYSVFCTKIAINEFGDGAILQVRDSLPFSVRIVPIVAGQIGTPDPPFSEPAGYWCTSDLVVTRSGRLYIGRDDVSTRSDYVTVVEYLGGGTTQPLEYYAMAHGRVLSNGRSVWMLGYEPGGEWGSYFAARRFDEDSGWQDAVAPPEFALYGRVLTFATAPDGSMLGVVQQDAYGGFAIFGIVYR